jgi:F-type H+-transporting ATPase subunit b
MNAALFLLAATAPTSHEPQLIDLDGTVFVQLGLFLLLVALLYRLLWRPYLRVRIERVRRVEGYRQHAARLEEEAAARLARAEAALEEARRVGSGERAAARTEAHAREQALLAEANAAAQRTLAEARARLNQTVAAERARLDEKAAEVGREAARKILGREVTA